MKIKLLILTLITSANVSFAQSIEADTTYFSSDTTKIYKIKRTNGDTIHLFYFDTTGQLINRKTAYDQTNIRFQVYGLERVYTEKSKTVYPKKNNDVYNHIDSIWSYDETGKLTSLLTTNASKKRTLSRTIYYDSLAQMKYIVNKDTRRTCGTIEAFDYCQNGNKKNARTYLFIWEDPFEVKTFYKDSISKEKMIAVKLISYENLEQGTFLIPYGKWIYYDQTGTIIKEKIYKRKKRKCP